MDGSTWGPSSTDQWMNDIPVVVIDNGSGVIKAGFAGEVTPRHVLWNCGAQPLGGIKRGPQQQQMTQSISSGVVTGDDIATLPDYFCFRPHQYGLLMDANLEVVVWEKLFSKQLLNVPDPSQCSLLVTEQFNTPISVRHLLTQIVFEEFGFQKMVISPAQQLVPFAFNSAPPPTPVDLWSATTPHVLSPTAKEKPAKKQRTGRKAGVSCMAWNSIKSTVLGDSFHSKSNLQNLLPESYCQLVVDVGHQTTWIVPMYGELPMDVGALRIDLGGAHASSLLKNLMAYQQVNLERSELLVHHIKEESCFVSLNYLEDLRNLKSQFSSGRKSTYITHNYILPDFNVRDKASLKNFFKTSRPTQIPTYKPSETESSPEYHVSQESINLQQDLRNMMKGESNNQQSGIFETFGTAATATAIEGRHLDDVGIGEDQTTLMLNVERVAPAEVFFNPQDYDLVSIPASTSSNVFFPSSSGHPSIIKASSSSKVGLSALRTPDPSKQSSIAEAIERSIFACPPVLQPLLSSRILLCGGSSSLPNFARRLYCELRPLLPQDWPVNIYQLVNPADTAWLGASVWASENGYANFDAFCVTRNQYMESGKVSPIK